MDPLKLQYVIELLKQGDGASAATVELQRLQEQGNRTAGAVKASSSGLVVLSDSSKTATTSLKAMSGVLQTVGFATFPQVTLAATTAANAIKAVGQAAKLSGLGAATTATFGGLLAAGGAAAYGIYDLNKQMDAAEAANENLEAQTRQHAERMRDIIARELETGRLIISEAEASAWDELLNNPTWNRLRMLMDQFRGMMPQGYFQSDKDKAGQIRGRQEDLNFLLQRQAALNFGPTMSADRARFDPLTLAAIQRDAQIGAAGKNFQDGLTEYEAYQQQLTEINRRYELERAGIAANGWQVVREAQLAEMSEAERVQARIAQLYAERLTAVMNYYDAEIQMAEGSASRVKELEEEKLRAIGINTQQLKRAQFQASEVGRVSQFAAENFSSGFASASVQFAASMGKNKEAVGQFFGSFMQQVAQMIMQMLILRAISSLFGIGSSGGGGGGGALGPGGNSAAFARGGFAPRLAASGALAGIHDLTGPTYFPNFNVLAGEAGREVMAVFAAPRLMSIGGMQAMTGSVQGNRLAMVNERELMARSGGGGGAIAIDINLSAGLEARITNSAVEGAVIRVNNDLQQDTPLARSAKRLSA